MLDRSRIFELFSFFADVEGEAAARLRPFCDAAAARLETRLRPGLEDIGTAAERLCVAAAACAWGDWMTVGGGAGSVTDEVRVGDITLRSGTGRGNAGAGGEELRERFLADVADLLLPPFVFGAMAGEAAG